MKLLIRRRRLLCLKLFIAFFFVFVGLCVFVLPERSKTKQRVLRQQIAERKRHLILLWTPYFGKHNWLPSTKQLKCPVGNCDTTTNRYLISNSSALVMHWRDIDPNDLPMCSFLKEPSSSCPYMVLFNKEAPPHTPADILMKINDKIHWTVTYRRDSDIKAPYGNIVPRKDTDELPKINLNRKGICWLVSNCQTPSHREKYVSELNDTIPVQTYGKCGNHACPYEKTIDCYKWMSSRCKFYLSFENSICEDYITEKLYNAMMFNMVPIVFGGGNYAEHLPPHSFIDVRDYSSPGELAHYILELESDDAKYLSYFQWQRKYLVQDAAYMWLCDLCEKLNTVEKTEVVPYESFIDWWNRYPCKVIY